MNHYDEEGMFPERLLEALRRAPVVPEHDINDYVAAGGRIGGRDPSGDPLSPRELETLRYLSRGLCRDQVATAMICPLETVKARLKGVRYKLGAKNTTHACCEAIRRGLIP